MSGSDILGQVKEFAPDIIGLTAATPGMHLVDDLAKALKEHFANIPIAVGGPHVTVLRERAMSPYFDYLFIGEADNSWPHFLTTLERGGDISQVKGVVFREKTGRARFTGNAVAVEDIDKVPFPARHLLRNEFYKYGTLQGRKRCTTIMASRGCPFQCIFCSTKVFGSKVRYRSPSSVVEEMAQAVAHYNVEHFYFLDDTFTLNREYILQLCDILQQRQLNITFEAGTRANLVDEELVSRLVKVGLVRISFGLEAVDEKVRRLMKKEIPLEAYTKANQLTNRFNVETLNSCMIGLPGETRETIRKTLAFLRSSREIKQANLSIAMPYPGTELFEMAKERMHGLSLLTEDYSMYRRYGSAVMQVGDLTAETLIRLQNDAFVSIYMAPWRWIPMVRKSGMMGALLMLLRLARSLKGIIKNEDGLFWFNGQSVHETKEEN